MPSPDRLVWTSRTDLCARLIAFLHSPSPEPVASDSSETPPARHHAIARLLAAVAPPAWVPELHAVVLDPSLDERVRRSTLYALRNRPEPLGVAALATLFSETVHASPQRDDRWWSHLGLENVVDVVRTAQEADVALEALDRVTPVARVRVLESLGWRDRDETLAGPLGALFDALYTRWLCEDRALVEAATASEDRDPIARANEDVAGATITRSASRALLLEAWCSAEGRARFRLLASVRTFPEFGGFAHHNPGALREAADALALPGHVLREYFGEAELARRTHAAVRAAWTEEDETFFVLEERARWAIEALATRADACAIAADLLADARSDGHPVVPQLVALLWSRERGATVDLALSAMRRGVCHTWVHDVLARAAAEPEATDRALFEAALRHWDDPEARAQGVRGLDALGETSLVWSRTVDELLAGESDEGRLWAACASVRRGDSAAEAALAALATGAARIAIREQAVRTLAEVGATGHVATLEAVLRQSLRECCPCCVTPGIAAARELAALGTPAALAALTRFALAAGEPDLADTLVAEVVRLATRLESAG